MLEALSEARNASVRIYITVLWEETVCPAPVMELWQTVNALVKRDGAIQTARNNIDVAESAAYDWEAARLRLAAQ